MGQPNPLPETPTFDDPSLPNELKGKTAAEIVAYYNDRTQKLEQRIVDATRVNAQPAPQPAPTPAPSAEPTATEFWNDPAKAVKAVSVSRAEFEQATNFVQGNMVEMARIVTKEKFSDFAKWEPEVRKIINTLQGFQKADPTNWETAYYYVKGQQYEKGVQEATVNATRMASEPPQTPASAPVVPEKLSAAEDYVAKGLGLSGDQYKAGKQSQAEDSWPITFDTRKRGR